MSVKAINSSTGAIKHTNLNDRQKSSNQQSFTGSFNPVVTVMDAIDKGGFAASFIAQDGIGMVAPRIYEGLNRNRQKDENGKKTGPLNWEFARREGIREILSGPSAFLIPMGILAVLKKTSGTANNVHVNHIEALGQNFVDYAAKNPEQLKDAAAFKKGYYTQVLENAIHHSTDKSLSGEELKQTAQSFADRLVEVETKRANKDKKGANKLFTEIVDDYMKLRKSHAAPSSNELDVLIEVAGKDKPLGTNFRRLAQSLTDYSGDALEKTNKFLAKNANGNLDEYIKKFNLHRAGTRVLSNLGMWAAVVGFYTLIPKLYNMGLKHDPGLKGLVEEGAQTPEDNAKAQQTDKAENKDKNKDVPFTGGFVSKAGETAMKQGGIGKVLKNFEFNGASMSVPAMLTLLFGFCLPPRYVNAKSDKERKEILVRDISSFTAILFGAKALSRGFSDAFAKASGLALNVKPEDHNKNFFNKFKNYFTAGSGVDVLTSEQIVSKYSNIHEYKDGINGFFDFIQENGGDVKKVLNIEKTVKEQSEEIMKKFNGKSIKDATLDEIKEAFKKAKNTEALEKIYTVFSAKDNKFINRAKTFNSAFGFASTLILVPAFMMWLARYCENMTKKAIAKEKEEKALATAQTEAKQTPPPAIIATSKPSMAGFLNK
ncbi:unknown [Clostridium sp. CAG:967]|nr:unknown [Clostridium sp. CAG:967]